MAAALATFRNIADLREQARRRLPRFVFDYIDGSADDELSAAENRAAFARTQLMPRYARDVAAVACATEIFGKGVGFPLMIAPTGYNGMLWRGGDLMLARAAQSENIVFVQSTMSSSSFADVAAAAPGLNHWFQLYVLRDRGVTRTLIERALAAGCESLVVTVDVPVLGNRERDPRHFARPNTLSLSSRLDLLRRPGWCANVVWPQGLPKFGNLQEFLPASASVLDGATYISRQIDPALRWQDIAWLRSLWPKRLVVKGLLSPFDAGEAAEVGADAIVVSNHGGRQLDGAPSPLLMLEQIQQAVAGRCTVLMDSGIRRGSDVFKAVALGATAAMAGRAVLYGLAAGGEAGAVRALRLLKAEFQRTMALTGTRSVAEINHSVLFNPAAKAAAGIGQPTQ